VLSAVEPPGADGFTSSSSSRCCRTVIRLTFTPTARVAISEARSSVTSVPPACTKRLSSARPASPSPPA
jgi:hypothetical protein